MKPARLRSLSLFATLAAAGLMNAEASRAETIDSDDVASHIEEAIDCPSSTAENARFEKAVAKREKKAGSAVRKLISAGVIDGALYRSFLEDLHTALSEYVADCEDTGGDDSGNTDDPEDES